MNVIVDNYEYTQLKSDIENIFKGIKKLLFKKLENPNDYWISFDFELTKKNSNDEYDFVQANENFNKMMNEKNKKIKIHEKKNKSKKCKKNKKRKSIKNKEVCISDKATSTHDLEIYEDQEMPLNTSSNSLISTKHLQSKKHKFIYNKEKKIVSKKNEIQDKSSNNSKKKKFRKSKKKNYFPLPDDDIYNEKSTKKILGQNVIRRKIVDDEETNNIEYDTTLETDINIGNLKNNKIQSSCNYSISKIDPNFLVTNNNALNFYRNETLKFLREACCNSRIVLFKSRKYIP
uniref:Uncharacterized protein n=1 Tax=Strongyloides stercoralis TaxID=6248 RepID=A0A0K0DX95_STRER